MNPDLAAHLNPLPTRWRRLARAWAAGPLRDTLLITHGAFLVGLGYMLHAWLAS